MEDWEGAEFPRDVLEQMRTAFLAAYQKLGRVTSREKVYLDKSLHTRKYKGDDRVWLFNPVRLVGCLPKLQGWRSGIWTAQEALSSVIYRIQWGRKKHVDLMKPAAVL